MRFERAPLTLPRRWWLLLCALAAGACAAEPVAESDMKAAFVFNFAVFTEWPRDVLPGGAPFNLCASGSGPLYASLHQLHDKLVNGHRIAVRQAVPPLRNCHLLVLERSDRERWGQLKRELAGATVLTVADDRVIGSDGAVIALSVEERRIGFDVDMNAAKSARLNLSSKLLRLARSVQ